jgi:hypothetical protein
MPDLENLSLNERSSDNEQRILDILGPERAERMKVFDERARTMAPEEMKLLKEEIDLELKEKLADKNTLGERLVALTSDPDIMELSGKLLSLEMKLEGE